LRATLTGPNDARRAAFGGGNVKQIVAKLGITTAEGLKNLQEQDESLRAESS
jgi:hypothetical protein